MTAGFLPLPTRRSTKALARALAESVQAGDLVVLSGGLGSGKTFLVRALSRALGLPEAIPVSSPSFPLLRCLPTRPPIAHADLYRLETPREAVELGLDELRLEGHVLIVEWGERFWEALGPDPLHIKLERQPRSAQLTGLGARGLALSRAVLGHPALTTSPAAAGPRGT